MTYSGGNWFVDTSQFFGLFVFMVTAFGDWVCTGVLVVGDHNIDLLIG